MNAKPQQLLTRKDIAQLMGVSVQQVRTNEARWDLRPYRRDLNARCIRYLPGALTVLKAKGFICVCY